MVAPTETLKFTLVVSSILSDLMAETIWVRFSGGGAAVAEVAALPVVWLPVEPDLLSAVLPDWVLVVGDPAVVPDLGSVEPAAVLPDLVSVVESLDWALLAP